MKLMSLILSVALAAFLGAGCGKPAAPSARPALPYALTSQTVAHFHWLGKKQLAATTNAANVMRIWDMPESAALETQVLDKLSTAPWRLLPHVATTNAAAAPLLRALLDDCVQAESYLEIRAATNQPGELAFAIRLPAARASVWQTNLATVLESLTGLRTTPSQPSTLNSQLVRGWSLKKHDAPNLIELTRVGEWIVLGIGQDQNALAGDFTARILRNHTPLLQASADFWVDARVDLRRVTEAFKLDWNLPAGLPEVSVQIAGDGQVVQTHGHLNFANPLPIVELEAWSFPTNLLRYPMASFTAVRGIAPWLASWSSWTNLQTGLPPNQFFIWASRDVPTGSYAAAPVPDVTNWIAKLGGSLNRVYGPRLEASGSGKLQINQESGALEWKTVPFATPFLEPQGKFAFAGMFPNAGLKLPMPAELLRALQPTNLVYYDWELTGSRIITAMRVAQFTRFILHRTQLSPSPSMAWLLANSTNLGPCITVVFQDTPQQLSFIRQSSGVGLTGMELQLFADWLEAPQFPRGLTSFEPAPQRHRPNGMPSASSPPSLPVSVPSPNP